MKFTLQNSLIKMGLLNEGWMDNLSKDYDEDTLIFTGRMLQQAFDGEDISNHPMAAWIAKAAKSFGSPSTWDDGKTKNITGSFQQVLNFIKNSENPTEATDEILRRNAKDSLAYIKEKGAIKPVEAEVDGEKELKEWIDKGLLKIIGRGPKGSFWVQPLKSEFFGVSQCGRNSSGEFGIGCQRGSGGGAAGFGVHQEAETYTLLGKSKEGYYTGIISTGYSPLKDEFAYHSLQYGNNNIGSQDWGDWKGKDFANAFVDFMTQNPYGKKMYKEAGGGSEDVWPRTNIPSRFKTIYTDHKDIFFRLLRNHPDFVRYYEQALRAELGKEFETFLIKARELYEQDPKGFIEKLPSYLQSEPEESINILKEINFEDFIRTHGKDVVENNLKSILSIMNYKDFNELIKPYIDFNSFLEATTPEDLKEILREFSEKENSAPKFLEILDNLIKENGEYFLKEIGDGNLKNGFSNLLKFLRTPRLSKHQNYKTEDGQVIATTEEQNRNGDGNLIDSNGRVIMSGQQVYGVNGEEITFDNPDEKTDYINSRVDMVQVERVVQPSSFVLDPNNIRKFLKNNKDLFYNVFGKSEKSEINLIRWILLNSNEKTREQGLRAEKEKIISYYDKEYKAKESKLPGFIVYSNLIHPVKGIFKVDKKDFKPYLETIIKYNYNSNQKKGAHYKKVNNAIHDTIQVATASDLHKDYIEKTLTPSLLKFVEKQGGIEGLVDFVSEYLFDTHEYSEKEALNILNREDIKETIYYEEFIDKLKLIQKEKGFIENIETHLSEGYNTIRIQVLEGIWIEQRSGAEKVLMKIAKEDEYKGKVIFDKNSKSIIYHPSSNFLKKRTMNDLDEIFKEFGNLEEQKVRKYIANLLESKYRKFKKKSL